MSSWKPDEDRATVRFTPHSAPTECFTPQTALTERFAVATPVDDRVELVSRVHLFTGLTRGLLDKLMSSCERRQLGAGDVLIEQGSEGDELFIVLSGRFSVHLERDEDGEVVPLGEVSRGEYLGEMALLDDQPRSATVVATTDCEVLVLFRPTLALICKENPAFAGQLQNLAEERRSWAHARRHRPDEAELLQLLADFTGLEDPGALSDLADDVEWVTLPRSSTLMRQGTRGDCMYFVVRGRLRAYAELADRTQVHVGIVSAGQTVGELALLVGELRAVSVAAERNCQLLRLSKRGFDALVSAHPQSLGFFLRLLAERLHSRTRGRSTPTQLGSPGSMTEDDCRVVVETGDLVLRNLRVTQAYHQLGNELAQLIGFDNVNWLTLACNASKTAGYSIRGVEIPIDDLRHTLRRLGWLERVLRPLGWFSSTVARHTGLERLLEDTLAEVSAAVSDGNLKVFEEVGPLFAVFCSQFRDAEHHDADALRDFLRLLTPGESHAGGQDLLRHCFETYYQAMFEPHPKRRAELVLLGNCYVGLHEQQRLQVNIERALNAPVTIGLRGILVDQLPGPLARRPALAGLVQAVIDLLTQTFRRGLTATLMRIRLPYGDLNLGRNLPQAKRGRLYPDMLQTFSNQELVRAWSAYDKSDAQGRGSRAHDWADYDDRMNFIINLFRTRQKSLELFDQPFTMEQRLEIEQGRVPAGPL